MFSSLTSELKYLIYIYMHRTELPRDIDKLKLFDYDDYEPTAEKPKPRNKMSEDEKAINFIKFT